MKTITSSRIGLLMFSMASGLTSAFSQNESKEKSLSFNTLSEKVLTITSVKRPWYAFRSLIISKMKQSVPEYQAISGLNKKFYAISEDRKFFGGIYLWQAESDARNWFKAEWFERIKKKYKTEGKVTYYQILMIKDFIVMDKIKTGQFWAALSSPSDSELPNFKSSISGLVKIISVKNENNQEGLITLWESKEKAQIYFSKQANSVSYFDTPILINNNSSDESK